MNLLTKVSDNNRAFSNKSVNNVLLSFGTSRENLAIGNYNMPTDNDWLITFPFFFSWRHCNRPKLEAARILLQRK